MDPFARYPSRSYTTMPDGLLAELVARRVGRNGWAVMAALAEDTAVACAKCDEAQRLRLEAIQRDFLKAHLNRWVCAFADAVERVEGISAFYPTFARFAALLCMRDPLFAMPDEG